MFKKDGSLEVKSGKIRWDIPSYPLSVGSWGALGRIQHETAPRPCLLGKLRLMEVGSSYYGGNLIHGKKQRALGFKELDLDHPPLYSPWNV